jgi:hypothetical protein
MTLDKMTCKSSIEKNTNQHNCVILLNAILPSVILLNAILPSVILLNGIHTFGNPLSEYENCLVPQRGSLEPSPQISDQVVICSDKHSSLFIKITRHKKGCFSDEKILKRYFPSRYNVINLFFVSD